MGDISSWLLWFSNDYGMPKNRGFLYSDWREARRRKAKGSKDERNPEYRTETRHRGRTE